MKVMCIDDKNRDGSEHMFLIYGEKYDVIGEDNNNIGEPCYILPFNVPSMCRNGTLNPGAYHKKHRFIPISDIDETEMVREYNLEKIS